MIQTGLFPVVLDIVGSRIFDQLIFLAPIGLTLVLEYSRTGGNYKTLGFSVSRFSIKEVSVGITSAAVALGILILATLVSGATITTFNAESLVDTVQTASLEEIGFRGVIFRAIEERFGSGMALVISSLLFAYAHFYTTPINYPAFLNIALAGVVFGAMYVLTRSLWMPIAFHFCWNYIEYSVFGRSPDPAIFAGIPQNFRWLFTGEYGIEQGLCTTIILVIILLILPKITTASPYAAAALFEQRFAEAKLKASYKI